MVNGGPGGWNGIRIPDRRAVTSQGVDPSMQTPTFSSVQLPVFLIVLFGGLGLIALMLLYRRNVQVRAAAEQQFKEFRERAVGLMDQIDALRARHKTLPGTDPDFTVPMVGETLQLYDKVAADLDRLWERWLAVMELWNRAEQRMKSASTFSAAPSEEAREIISESRLEDLLQESGRCKEELDRLNLAHEVATKALRDARREAALLAREAGRGDDRRKGEADLYERELRVITRELDDAEEALAADPVGAATIVERSRDAIAGLRHPPAPRGPRAGYAPTAPSRTILDDLAVAAVKLQELTSKIRVMDIIGLLIKGWVALWVLGLFLAVLPALMPLILIFMAFVVFGSGFRVFRSLAAPWSWDRIDPRAIDRRWVKRGRKAMREWRDD